MPALRTSTRRARMLSGNAYLFNPLGRAVRGTKLQLPRITALRTAAAHAATPFTIEEITPEPLQTVVKASAREVLLRIVEEDSIIIPQRGLPDDNHLRTVSLVGPEIPSEFLAECLGFSALTPSLIASLDELMEESFGFPALPPALPTALSATTSVLSVGREAPHSPSSLMGDSTHCIYHSPPVVCTCVSDLERPSSPDTINSVTSSGSPAPSNSHANLETTEANLVTEVSGTEI